MKLSKRTITPIVIIITTTLITVLFYFSPFAKKAAAETPSFKAEKGTLTVSVNGTGVVMATEKDDITAKKSGIVKAIYKFEDDQVKAGELIMELKDDDININIEDITMNIKNLERDLNKRIEEKNNQFVKAPVDGVISDISVDEGDSIKSSTVIANITNFNKYRLMAPVLFNQIGKIIIGQKVNVFLPEYLRTVDGTVINTANSSKPGAGGSVWGNVEVEVPNIGGIKIGAKARASFPTLDDQEILEQDIGKLEVFKKSTVKYETTRTVTVREVYVREDEYVTKGQLLMELNDENFETDIDNLQSRLRKAQLQLENLLYQKSNLKIHSTLNGTISKQKVYLEDGVNMGQIVSTISDYSKMEFSIPVDELDISKIQLGMKVDVTVDALPGRQYKGEVCKIANEGVSQNGVATYMVTVKILDPKGLKVGMSANAQIILRQKKDVLMLRMGAVQQYNKNYYVIPKFSDGRQQDVKDPKKQMLQVEVGINNKDYIEIVKGLNEGDEVYSPRPVSKGAQGPANTNPLGGMLKK